MGFFSDFLNLAGAGLTGNKVQAQQSSDQIKRDENNIFADWGIIPKKVDEAAPGAQLDTTQDQADRARLQTLIQQLQGMAQTGQGDWQNQLAKTSLNAQQAATSLGTSENANQGLNRLSALQAEDTSRANASQRGFQQGQQLQGMQKLQAQQALSNILGLQGQQDMTVAQQAAAAEQAVREINSAMAENAQNQTLGMVKGGGQAAMAFASKGGKVPGKPKVFGDNERNDTVRAMLSPGEVVIPRSIMTNPNAAQEAAKFVQKQKMQHFDQGGLVNQSAPDISSNNAAQLFFDPIGGLTSLYKNMNPVQDPSIQNGGLLNLNDLNATRDGYDQLLQTLQNNNAGQQIVDSQTQNAQDQVMHNILAEAAKGNQAGKAALIDAGTQHMQEIAGKSAGQIQGFQGQNMQSMADLMGQRRALDINQEIASQKAAWSNTMLNAHITMAQQQMMLGLLSGAGQAATHFASNRNGNDKPGDISNPIDSSENLDESGSPEEWGNGGDSGDSGGGGDGE